MEEISKNKMAEPILTMKQETVYDLDEIDLDHLTPAELERMTDQFDDVEEISEEATQELVTMQNLVQGKYAPALATGMKTCADLNHPAHREAPPKESFKQRTKKKVRLHKARKNRPYIQPEGLAMYDSLSKDLAMRRRILKPMDKEIKASGVDPQLLHAFSIPCRYNGLGLPATKKDEQARKANNEFVKDYISGDVKLRWKHLDRMVNSVLTMNLHPNLLDKRYLARYAADVRNEEQQLVFAEEAMKDPINAEYFEHMDPTLKQTLEEKLNSREAMALHEGLGNAFRLEGIKGDLSGFHDPMIYEDTWKDGIAAQFLQRSRTQLKKQDWEKNTEKAKASYPGLDKWDELTREY